MLRTNNNIHFVFALPQITVSVRNCSVLTSTVSNLMNIWEETSYHLELLQTNAECAYQEYTNLKNRSCPPYHLTFDPEISENSISQSE